jgi:hypothetical protein
MNAQKKVSAHRLSARDGSGPKTATGKRNSRSNATKTIDNPGVDEISPPELFKRLRDQEDHLSKDAFERLQTLFANERFLSYPLFDPPDDLSDEFREPFSDPGVRYNFLLVLLKRWRTRENRLFILATWLHLEGIPQPENLLGKDFSPYRWKAVRGSRGRLSFTDLRQAFIVNDWKPYFDQLVRAQRNGLDLRQLGFEKKAIQSAFGKRSAVAAACDYLSSRLGVDAPALANAYSRVYSRVKERNPGFPTHDRRPVS